MPRYRLFLALSIVLGLLVPASLSAAGETEFVFAVHTPAFERTASGVAVPGYVLDNTPGAPQLPVHGLVVELAVSNRAGFRSWLMSFLDRAEVLAPESVRDEVVAWLEAAVAEADPTTGGSG